MLIQERRTPPTGRQLSLAGTVINYIYVGRNEFHGICSDSRLGESSKMENGVENLDTISKLAASIISTLMLMSMAD